MTLTSFSSIRLPRLNRKYNNQRSLLRRIVALSLVTFCGGIILGIVPCRPSGVHAQEPNLISKSKTPGLRMDRPNERNHADDDEVQTLSLCDLAQNRTKYYGRLVRVTATMLTLLDSVSLFDAKCPGEGIEPVLDCDGDEECSRLRTMLDEKSDFDGDVSRVEAVLIGRLRPPTDPKRNDRLEFVYQTIEETRRIPSYVPWARRTRITHN